jgi:hypothetical protein
MGLDAAARQRPGGLTAVCIIAIVLGVLGLCGSVLGVASVAFQGKLQALMKQQQELAPKVRNNALKQQMEIQNKVSEATQKVANRHLGVTSVFLALNLLLSAGLLAGGIATLKLSPKGRQFLMGVFLAAIVFEILRSILTVFTQLDMVAELSAIRNVGGPADMPLTLAKAGIVGGLVLGLVLVLGMVVFYAIGASYLRRPKVLALFERPAADSI